MQTALLCTNPVTDPMDANMDTFSKSQTTSVPPVDARQTAELHFKAENLGAGCERVFVNLISQHTRLIDSVGIQTALLF